MTSKRETNATKGNSTYSTRGDGLKGHLTQQEGKLLHFRLKKDWDRGGEGRGSSLEKIEMDLGRANTVEGGRGWFLRERGGGISYNEEGWHQKKKKTQNGAPSPQSPHLTETAVSPTGPSLCGHVNEGPSFERGNLP